MRAGFLGPEGTYSHEALLQMPGASAWELVPAASIRATVLAVRDGDVDGALVPIENAIEGSVHATLDTLTTEAPDVHITAELVHPIHHCLIGRGAEPDPATVSEVISHPQALAQCAGFVRDTMPRAIARAAASTAEAVRQVMDGPQQPDEPRAAIGSRAAAERFGASVWAAGVEDVAGNETRFAWLSRDGSAHPGQAPADARWKTALVWWGTGADSPGWLVRCLSEFAFRGVNLTRIESRPRRDGGLGEYLFFADADGSLQDPPVASAVAAVAAQAEGLRVLGSFPSR